MKKTDILKIFFGIFFLVQLDAMQAQPNYAFKHLTINNGLSNNQINCIFKDSQGFMWFGTLSGLNRYDGNTFKTFTHEHSDSTSIVDNNILAIYEDFKHNLWINTGSGFTVYITDKEQFVFPLQKYLESYGFNEEPAFVFFDKANQGYLLNELNECFLFSEQNARCQLIDALPKELITGMYQVESTIYTVFSTGRIVWFNAQKQEIARTLFLSNVFDLPQSNTFHILVDPDNDLWLYQETNPNGIYFYNTHNSNWSFLSTNKKCLYPLSSNTVKDITSDGQGLIWIATDHGGINIINKNTKTIRYIEYQPNDARSIPEKSIMCLYRDNENNIWAGSYKYGISFYNESVFKFKHIRQNVLGTGTEFDNDINTFQEDLDGNLWIGSNNKGLMRIDNLTGQKTIFQHIPGQTNALSSNVIVSMVCDHTGKLWIGTYQGGLNCFEKNKFYHYKHIEGDANSLANDNIWDLLEDSFGNLWIATLGGGIDKMNLNTGQISHFSNQTYPELASDFVINLQETAEKNILIATAHGLSVYYPKTDSFKTIRGNFSESRFFSNNNILCVHEDSRGLIWVGTRDGLNIINPKTDELFILTRLQGIADNVIYGIVEDDAKNIWISTANGLSHIVLSINPRTGEYNFIPYNYDEKDGLQGKAFNERAAYKTSSGEIIFGGTNGYNLIEPSGIKYNSNRPQLVFTDFLLFNQSVKIDSLYHRKVILDKSISKTREVNLHHQENIFTIVFSALNFLQPDKTVYFYKLEGFDNDWVTIRGKNPRATYTNLDAGTYTFFVKAANNDGFTSEEPIALRIIVHPPFWRSTWAYVLYYLLITGLVFLAIRIVRNRIRFKFEMAQERLEAKRTRELDQIKLRFFTNISHEFRTQISLIVTPLDKLIKRSTNDDDLKTLKLINRNANKLLQMVNQILDFRKMDMKGHKLNLSNGDVVHFIREICHAFAETYDKKNIHLTFSSVSEEIRMNFDEDKLSKIINNLLSNAYKFTPEQGNIEVKLAFINQKNEQMLKVSVADTGLGVKEEARSLIFERFYQVDVPETKATGSGIGLHICKEFVSLHGGQIWMEPNSGQGSVFIFTIPIVNNNISDFETHEVIETLSLPDSQNTTELLPGHSRKKTILLVDDNEDFRIFLRDSLHHQFEILDAENGKKALEMVMEHVPDLIISDVMMPELDGYELCKIIKNDVRSSHIPIVLLTARTANEHVVQGLETGADDYIAKPFNLDILLLRINKLIEQREEVHNQILQKKEINPSEIKVSSLDEQLIDKAIKCVEENMDNADFSVELLSQEMGMSRVHLYKKLVSITGKTPIEFIRILRLKRAAQLLGKSQLTVSEVAYQVGFNNPKYFSRYFKEEFGELPSVFAERNK